MPTGPGDSRACVFVGVGENNNGKDFGPPLEDAFWQQAKCAENLKVFLTARFYFFAVHAAQGAWVDRLGRKGNRQEE